MFLPVRVSAGIVSKQTRFLSLRTHQKGLWPPKQLERVGRVSLASEVEWLLVFRLFEHCQRRGLISIRSEAAPESIPDTTGISPLRVEVRVSVALRLLEG